MKTIFYSAIFFFIGAASFAQTPDLSLIPYRSGDRWGFADADKNILISPAYEEVDWFSEGYAAVKKSGKWGYINKAGKLVIPLKFTVAKPFRKGFMPLADDAGGDSVLFAGASLQADGYEICINTKGQRMPQCPAIPENDVEENAGPVKQVEKEKNYSLPNSEGLFDKIVDDYSLQGNNETYYIAIKNGMYGVINSKFDEIIPFELSKIQLNKNLDQPYLEVTQNGTVGLYSPLGKPLLEPVYHGLLPIQTSTGRQYVIVQKDGKYFVKDLGNQDFIALGFKDIFYDERGGFVVTDENNLKGFYFMNGENIPAKYVDIRLMPGGDYLAVKTFNGKMGYVDAHGNEFFVE